MLGLAVRFLVKVAPTILKRVLPSLLVAKAAAPSTGCLDARENPGGGDYFEGKLTPRGAMNQIIDGVCQTINSCEEELNQSVPIDDCMTALEGELDGIADELGFQGEPEPGIGSESIVFDVYADTTGSSFDVHEESLSQCLEEVSLEVLTCNHVKSALLRGDGSSIEWSNWEELLGESGDHSRYGCDTVFSKK